METITFRICMPINVSLLLVPSEKLLVEHLQRVRDLPLELSIGIMHHVPVLPERGRYIGGI